jgi:cytochrome c551/c552
MRCWLIGLAAAGLLDADGLLLLGELGCINCHTTGAALDARRGPVLTGAGSRLHPDHIRDIISGVKASAMPRIPLSQADVTTLTRLIAASKTDRPPMPDGNAARGRSLYERTGCAGCHGLSTPPTTAKFLPGALAAFLLDPLATHPSARMPRLPLDAQQAADLEAFLGKPAGAAAAVDPPSADARSLFSSAGCANCHEFDVRAQPRRPLASLKNPDRGCLDPAARTTPRFDLTEAQRSELGSAIQALAKSQSLTESQRLELRLEALGCYNCHSRNNKGGPQSVNANAFTVLEDTDLGDEGRFPPPLTAIGYKLTPDALGEALRGRTNVHPAMATRMPDYGPVVASQLTKLLTAVDMPAHLQPIEQNGRNAFGRELVGTQGLGCINCHNLRGRKSLGINASDLALAPQRLRVEWFRDFLIQPARFHPATRMPSFWPGGKATQKAVLRGNTDRQIDSIWVYLMEIDQTRLPAGLEEKGAFELKPVDKAIVLRAFMKDAGTHAVAVGFPGGLNAAFDSNRARWALLWRGRFVDAESVWEDRFNPPMSPLGTNVLSLSEGGNAAVVFRGYQLGERGIPTFLYDRDRAHVKDTLTPGPDGSFRRILEIETPTPRSFPVAAGTGIERQDSWFVIDGRLRVRVPGQEAGQQRDAVVLNVPAGRHTFEVEMAW